VIDVNGCKDTTSATLFINTKPNISIADTTICAGDVAGVFDAGAGFTSYAWSVNGTGTSQTTARTTAGVYTVRVVDANGCKDTTSATLTINTKPNISVADTTICDGDVAGVFNAGSGFTTYNWTGNGTGTSQTTARTTAGVYTVRVVDANGCKDTTSATLFINTKPDISIADTTICDGDVAGVFNAGSGFTTYNWTGNGTGTSQTTARTTAGVYTVRVVDANGCKDTTSATLTINTKPNISIADTTICAGDVAGVFDAGAGFTNYNWSANGTGTSQTTARNVAGVYTVHVVDANGCKDTTSASLLINSKPVVSVADTTVCAGSPAHVFDAGAGYSSYTWSDNGTGISRTTSGTTAGKYTVSVIDSKGCKDTTFATLTVNQLPNVSLNLDPNRVCIDHVPFNVSGGSPSGGTYSMNGIDFTSFDPAAAGKGKHAIKYTVTNIAGCSNFAVDTMMVDTLPTPTIAPIAPLCKDALPFLLSGSPVGGSWKINSSPISNPASFNPALYSAGSHIVQYNYTDTHGCKASASKTVIVNALPVPVITAPAEICSNGSVAHLMASLTPGIWLVDGQAATEYFNPALFSAGVHTFTYVHTDTNNCTGVHNKTITINTKTTPVISAIDDECVNAVGSSNLFATPTGGVWKLDGTSNSGVLTLGSLSAGNHTAQYIYTDAKSCVDTASDVFEIFDTTQVTLPAVAQFCEGESYTYTLPNLWSTYKWNTILGSNTFTVSNATQTVFVVVTDANGCSTQAISVASEIANPTPDLGNDIELCAGESATLDPGTANNLTYLWTPNSAATPTLKVSISGTYKVSVADGFGCKGFDSVAVLVHDLPQVSLGNDTAMCDNGYDRLMLHATYAAPMQILWSTYEKNVDSIQIGMVGEYWIQVTDSNSCVNKDYISVVHKCPDYKFTWPNVFTPNADGYNDEFSPKDISDENFMQAIANMQKIEFEVYNRWGVKVFESVNVIPRWDGRFNGADAPAGTYYWIVKYTNTAENSYEDKGFVQVIR
jgi:gliding motility-associated-like protein